MPSEQPTGTRVYRWTLWTTDDDEGLQLSLAVLNECWEPLHEETVALGPFHHADEARAELQARAVAYFAIYGHQLALL